MTLLVPTNNGKIKNIFIIDFAFYLSKYRQNLYYIHNVYVL